MMEQKAEALGAAGFLSTCLFPQPTHFPPAHTTHHWEPPQKLLSLILTERPRGVSVLAHMFVPCRQMRKQTGGSEPGPGLSKAGGRLEEGEGCKLRLTAQTPSPRPSQSPSSQSPYHTSSSLHIHSLPGKSLEVPAVGGSQPSLPPRLLWIPGPMFASSHWGTGGWGGGGGESAGAPQQQQRLAQPW